MTSQRGSGPTPDEITAWITAMYPGAVVAEAMGATFFSLDENHWPNFATIVTTDEHDVGSPSALAREGVFRLNIGVGPETFRRVVGHLLDADAKGYVPRTDVDYSVLDTLLPHPVYAGQRWLCVLNPSAGTFEESIKPLIVEAETLVRRQQSKAVQPRRA